MAHHLHVRRMLHKPFILFNEHDGAFSCTKHNNTVSVHKQVASPWSSPRRVLFTPLLKPKPFTLMLSKGTELGVTDFYPVISEHTQARSLNMPRMQQVCLEALEQCERFTPPTVHAPQPLQTILQQLTIPTLVALERSKAQNPAKITTNMPLLIGPEGGFSENEKAALQSHDLCVTVSFGPAILRAETAVLYGLAYIDVHQST